MKTLSVLFFSLLSMNIFAQSNLIESCFEKAVRQGVLQEEKVKTLLTLQTKITLLKLLRMQMIRFLDKPQFQDLVDLESSLLYLMKERDVKESELNFFKNLKNKNEFFSQIFERYPNLFMKQNSPDERESSLHFDETDAILIALYTNVEKNEKIQAGQILNIAETVNRGLTKAVMSLESLNDLSVKIENLENDFDKKCTQLMRYSNCEMSKDCVQCNETGKKSAALQFLISVEKMRLKKSNILPQRGEIWLSPLETTTTLKKSFFISEKIENEISRKEDTVPLPYTIDKNNSNRTTILKSYALGATDLTKCSRFGIFDKKSGKLEIFTKNNLKSPEVTLLGLCGGSPGDEDTRWEDKEGHKGNHKTPAGSFTLSRYPEGRPIPELFGEDALLVHSEFVKNDRTQGSITELPVFAVHAIPEHLDAKETELRYASLKSKQNLRRTNGCLNLSNRAGKKDFDVVKELLGDQCKLYILPDDAENKFIMNSSGILEFQVKKPDLLTEAEFSNRYFYSRKKEKDLKLKTNLSLTPKEAEFKSLLEQPSLREYFITQYDLSVSDYAKLMKLSLVLYKTLYSEESIEATKNSSFRNRFRGYRDSLQGRDIYVEVDGKFEKVVLKNVGVTPISTAAVMMRYLSKNLKSIKIQKDNPEFKEVFKSQKEDFLFYVQIMTGNIDAKLPESDIKQIKEIRRHLSLIEVYQSEADLRVIPRKKAE